MASTTLFDCRLFSVVLRWDYTTSYETRDQLHLHLPHLLQSQSHLPHIFRISYMLDIHIGFVNADTGVWSLLVMSLSVRADTVELTLTSCTA